jgi:hypothetical protein
MTAGKRKMNPATSPRPETERQRKTYTTTVDRQWHTIGIIQYAQHNAATIEDNVAYVVNVGFGSSGPTHPMPLIANEITTNSHKKCGLSTPPSQISPSLDQNSEHRNALDQPWLTIYPFSEHGIHAVGVHDDDSFHEFYRKI